MRWRTDVGKGNVDAVLTFDLVGDKAIVEAGNEGCPFEVLAFLPNGADQEEEGNSQRQNCLRLCPE